MSAVAGSVAGGAALAAPSLPRQAPRRRSPALRKAFPYLLVAPALLYLLAITLYPGIFAIFQSLYVVRFNAWNWAGPDNYTTLLKDREFWLALGNTAIIGGISLVLQTVIALTVVHPRLAHPFPHADAVHAFGGGLHLEARLQ
jgi:multiple sugar transport system permease protein